MILLSGDEQLWRTGSESFSTGGSCNILDYLMVLFQRETDHWLFKRLVTFRELPAEAAGNKYPPEFLPSFTCIRHFPAEPFT